ncbi:MAG: hypothetical protein OHK0015_23310 [Chloroflexi bacterium OHK40]
MKTWRLIRWAGVSMMLAGLIFAAIQPFHPLDVLESVTTTRWVLIQSLKTAMCAFGLFGLTGLYARQASDAGWLGLAGYLLFSLFYLITLPFAYAEAVLLPLLAAEAPTFVQGFLGIFNGSSVAMDLGALPALYAIAGLGGYVLGGLVFGVATVQAGVLPRWPAILLAGAAVSPLLLSGLLPHPLDRILAVPMGVALVWLGYALWSEHRALTAGIVPGTPGARLT